jgi:hypothetical protein
VLDGTLSRSMKVGSTAVGAGATAAGGAAGAALLFLVLLPASGVGATTTISGSWPWADTPDGTSDSPAAIAGATIDERRPRRKVTLLICSPYGHHAYRDDPCRRPMVSKRRTTEAGGFAACRHGIKFLI